MAATDRTYNDRVAINYMLQQQRGYRITGGHKLYVATTDRTYSDRVAIYYMWQQRTGYRMTGWQ